MKVFEDDSGSQVIGYDPSTRAQLSIQPFFADDCSAPSMVVVGNYFPQGVVPVLTAEALRDMEKQTQKEFGADYNVRLIHRVSKILESIEFILTRS